MPLDIRHNPEAQRFEVSIEGTLAVLEYTLGERLIAFTHTLVPEELGGQGVGGQLARAGLEYAREHRLTVDPVCPFIASYIEKHQEYQALLDQAAGRI